MGDQRSGLTSLSKASNMSSSVGNKGIPVIAVMSSYNLGFELESTGNDEMRPLALEMLRV